MAKTRRSLPRKSYTETGVVDNMNRRLTESEVKSIFACVMDNKGPAENIAFKIIKTQNNKPMLSPPALELEDGIYVLLHSANARVPSRLDYLVNRVASEHECKWSLSGPSPSASSKVEGAVQQRYSYPKGRAEYSNTKGGSLWTILDRNGKDNLEVRIFHVYQSFKRLGSSSSDAATTASSASGGSSDWSSISTVSKKMPPKKRIKIMEDKRVAGAKEVKPKKKVRIEEDAIDTLLRDEIGSPPDTAFDGMNIASDVFGDDDTGNGYSFYPISNAPSILHGSISSGSAFHPPTKSLPKMPSYGTLSHSKQSPAWKPMGLLAFSNKLYALQDSIMNDISFTPSIEERAHKISVLQHWAKVTAQRPLQPNTLTPADSILALTSTGPTQLPATEVSNAVAEVGSNEEVTTSGSKIGDGDASRLPRITP